MFKARRTFAYGCLLAVVASSCAAGNDDPRADRVAGQLVVFAAASLTDVFDDIVIAFEQANPGTDVVLNLAASSTLREQILEGAPADLFASADERNMTAVDTGGELASQPTVFALNRLQLAVPPGNPGDVGGLNDLSRPELLVGVCAAGVPCGDLTRDVLEAAEVEASIDTNEANVRALLTRIEADELDVGIVYSTDVQASDRVVGLEIPEAVNVEVRYPIAQLEAGSNPLTAIAFVDFLRSPAGEQILVDAGFELP